MHKNNENLPFMLNLHTTIIKDKLETIYAVASTTRRAEQSVKDLQQNTNLITMLVLIEDISSDFESVYEVERLLKALSEQVLEAENA